MNLYKRVALGIASVLLALSASACGHRGHHVSPQASASAQADAAKAQAIIQKCATKSNLVTKAGRKAFYNCIAPAGKQAQVEKCAQAKFAADGVLSKKARAKLYNDLAGCIL